MWYAILSEDVPNSAGLRAGARSAHVARVQALVDQGRLLVAGPHPAIDAVDPGDAGFTGSLIIADFPTRDAAQQWANDDPYVAAGVYARVVVKPFKVVLP